MTVLLSSSDYDPELRELYFRFKSLGQRTVQRILDATDCRYQHGVFGCWYGDEPFSSLVDFLRRRLQEETDRAWKRCREVVGDGECS